VFESIQQTTLAHNAKRAEKEPEYTHRENGGDGRAGAHSLVLAIAAGVSVAANFRGHGTSKRFIGSDRRTYQISRFPLMLGIAASGCVERVVRGTKGAADQMEWVKNQQSALEKCGADLRKSSNTYAAINHLLDHGRDRKTRAG